MEKEKEKWWGPTGKDGLAFKMAKFFTEDMSADLQHLAQFFARNYIEAIYKKALRQYNKDSAQKQIDLEISLMEQRVKSELFKQDFEIEVVKDQIVAMQDTLKQSLNHNLPSNQVMKTGCEDKLR